VSSDNTTVIAYINHLGGTKSAKLHEQATELALLLEEHQIILTASYIPGRDNVLADRLSRQTTPVLTEWHLAPRVAQLLFQKWGTPMIDAFAAAGNNQLGTYCSLFPDPNALCRDAFSIRWDHRYLFLFPPPNSKLLLQVLMKFRQSPGAMAILVAPHHPNALYFSLIQEMLMFPAFPLPLYPDLLVQGCHRHPFPQKWNLHAYKLCAPSC
jgi:hypothetical protein